MSKSLFRKKSIEKIIKDAEEGLVDAHEVRTGLRRILTARDLTFMGIAAVVGAGIFSTIGTAAYNGGPGISLLFIITAVTCGFSALCYAEFASRVPISGSGYFNNLLEGFGVHLPVWLTIDPGTAKNAYLEAEKALAAGEAPLAR